MINQDKLQNAINFINRYNNNKNILKINYDYLKTIIDELNDAKEDIYISTLRIDFTIEELKAQKRLYGKALSDMEKRKKVKNND